MNITWAEYAYTVEAAVVFEFLHQADLCLLFNRFVRWTIFADAEGIVCPDEFHWQFHESCHTDGRFHIVGEHEEGSHCRDDTSVERHTDADTCHCQFRNASLEKSACKVGACDHRRVLQETIRFV